MIFRLNNWDETKRAKALLEKWILEKKVIEFKVVSQKRTDRQNRSLHLYFELVANELSSAGFELRDLVKDEIPIPITKESVKALWKRMQKKMYGTTSTTKLQTNQVSEIYDAMNIVISERLKIFIPFPNFGHNIKC